MKRLHRHHGVFLAAFFLTLLLLVPSPQADRIRAGHVQLELISENKTISPGEPFWVGLHFVLDDHWHLYWTNPGDAGLPPKAKWRLPEGFSAGELVFAYPEYILTPPLAAYGYNDSVLYVAQITPPTNLRPGETIPIAADVTWLVCKEECLPGDADVGLELEVTESSSKNSSVTALFDSTRQNHAKRLPEWDISASADDDKIVIRFSNTSPFALDTVLFFPHTNGLIKAAAVQELEKIGDNGYRLIVPRSSVISGTIDSLTGILYSSTGWDKNRQIKSMYVNVSANSTIPAVAVGADDSIGILAALGFAFLGGLILNLMPCVLPVLSLKIMGFVGHAGESRRKAFTHGTIFALGVLISFWVLTGLLLGLRAGGEQLGWGFQLQSPGFLVILSTFMFLFGLNLLGVFEIGTSLTSVNVATGKVGYGGSFLNGVTATIVATPCTAPFMGSAIGFSLAQPAWAVWMIFTSLALGMAFPYLVLSGFPALLKFIPKPGAWMETMKQAMGFLLLATVIWLAWVLGIQAGSTAIITLMATLLLAGLGAWILGKWGTIANNRTPRIMAQVTAIVLLVLGVTAGLSGAAMAPKTGTTETSRQGSINWEKFSPEKVSQLQTQGKKVFIDFTAAWCLSCKVNEQVAFGAKSVQDRIRELDVVMLKADWTTRDETITRALAEFGRNSVPLYVLYDGTAEPVILPEILTPGIVLDALAKLDK